MTKVSNKRDATYQIGDHTVLRRDYESLGRLRSKQIRISFTYSLLSLSIYHIYHLLFYLVAREQIKEKM